MKWLLRLIDALMLRLYPSVPAQPAPEPAPEPLNEPVEPVQPSPGELLYATAKACIGKDVTPLDEVPDYVACVSSLQAIFFKAAGSYIGKGAARSNTLALRKALDADPRFTKIAFDEIKPGTIVVAATGEGKDPNQHGHCWLTGMSHWMSNNSADGIWMPNYTWAAVRQYYERRDGFPLHAYHFNG